MTLLNYDAIGEINSLLPLFNKIKQLSKSGKSYLNLHFHEGGLRSPRIKDEDKSRVSAVIRQFLLEWQNPRLTGHLRFYLYDGCFTGRFSRVVRTLTDGGEIVQEVGFEIRSGEGSFFIEEVGKLKHTLKVHKTFINPTPSPTPVW